MFTAEFRDQVRTRVVELGRLGSRVTGGAVTGSTVLGVGDAWSDIDLAFAIVDRNKLEDVGDDWTPMFDREYGLLHHFDMHVSDKRVSRAFLLPGGLDVDVVVLAAEEFGARGPKFRALFGTPVTLEAPPQPEPAYLCL